MNRREAMRSIGGLLAVSTAAAVAPMAEQGTYGYLSVDNCASKGISSKNVHVYLDGVDITDRKVLAADDRRGFAVVFSRNAKGFMVTRDGKIARETLHGRVRFEVRA